MDWVLKTIYLRIGLWVSIAIGISSVVYASGGIPDPNSLISSTVANAFVKSVGIAMDHRPYEPATPIGTAIGLSLGLEVTLVQPPSDLGSSLGGLAGASSGSSSSSSSSAVIPILPSLKLHFHKGIGSNIDIGLSALPPIGSLPLVGGSLLLGGDVKVVVYNPEEGPTWAVRGCYNINSLSYSQAGESITVKTITISPQVLVSRKLDFADPYIGIGVQYTYGSIKVSIPIPAVSGEAIAPVEATQNGVGYGAEIFGGIDLRIPNVGFRITLEGAYSPFGMNSLGTKLGFAF